MTRKISQVFTRINDGFSEKLRAAVADKFPGLEIETTYDIVAMRRITHATNRRRFTAEQVAFISAFELGYRTAMEMVHD